MSLTSGGHIAATEDKKYLHTDDLVPCKEHEQEEAVPELLELVERDPGAGPLRGLGDPPRRIRGKSAGKSLGVQALQRRLHQCPGE